MRFNIAGARPCIRSEEELALLDKKAADAAFRTYKRVIIDPCMTAQGFFRYKSRAYVRRNRIDLLEYLDFQKEQYGSKTFTVNLAVMPLYTPHESIVFGFSARLGMLICGRDIWWDFADDAACKTSMDNVSAAMQRFGFPWFGKMSHERRVVLQLLRQKWLSRLSSYDREWLQAIGSRSQRTAVIRKNIEKLKLPPELMQEDAAAP